MYTSFDGVSMVVLDEEEVGKDVEMCREEVVGGVEGMPVDWGVREEEEEGEDIVDRKQESGRCPRCTCVTGRAREKARMIMIASMLGLSFLFSRRG